MIQNIRCILRNSVPILRHPIKNYSASVIVSDVKADKVEYPPILDLSYRAKKRRKQETWYDEIKKCQTVEEKLIKLNMPKYYGWPSIIYTENNIPYNSLHQVQYITRTHVFYDSLPIYYDQIVAPESIDKTLQEVKNQIIDNIEFEQYSRRRHQSDNEAKDAAEIENRITNDIIYQINKTISKNLVSKYNYLLEMQTDVEPRIEAFWFAGGLPPHEMVRKSLEGREWTKEYAKDPRDRCMHYTGYPALQLRHQLPLREFIPMSESKNDDLHIPEFKYDPRVVGFFERELHGTSIPGFWPGDPNEFGFLSYHNRGHLLTRKNSFDDMDDAVVVQAILASFGWLHSQACYQGFSTYQDVTYPLSSQAVITNGQLWSFIAYQLNTTLLYAENVDENPKRNLCWITKPMKLYETIENGKVCGFDEDVLKLLLKFYMNEPRERVGVDMKPYLGKSVKLVADIEEDERRNWLERSYKHIVSNRPRHKRIPEIYHWQKIYKIDNKTCPMHKKRDPWEFGFSLGKRRLDQHLPVYIPRVLRENPKKRKIGRWAKTYYP